MGYGKLSDLANLQMRIKGFGILFYSPISSKRIRFSGYAFVDGTNLLQVLSVMAKWGCFITPMQKVLDSWERGLKIAGGAIVPNKPFVSYWL
jgi:hypothetical protein